MKKTLILIVIAWALMSPIRTARANPPSPAIFNSNVSSINRHELYASGLRFFIDRDVQLFLYKDGGSTLSLKSLVAMGQIKEARLYVFGNRVKKIIVLQMEQ